MGLPSLSVFLSPPPCSHICTATSKTVETETRRRRDPHWKKEHCYSPALSIKSEVCFDEDVTPLVCLCVGRRGLLYTAAWMGAQTCIHCRPLFSQVADRQSRAARQKQRPLQVSCAKRKRGCVRTAGNNWMYIMLEWHHRHHEHVTVPGTQCTQN